jgi:hypothetical protein
MMSRESRCFIVSDADNHIILLYLMQTILFLEQLLDFVDTAGAMLLTQGDSSNCRSSTVVTRFYQGYRMIAPF